MKKVQEYPLTNSGIDAACREMEDILKKHKVDSKEIVKVRLKAEEIMSFYQSRSDVPKTFTVKYAMGFDKRIAFLFEGESVNPFVENRDEFLDNIMKMLGETEHWQYKYNTNIIDFKIPKKPLSQVLQICIAILCALLFAAIAVNFFPAETTESIRSAFFTPAVDLFVGVLRSTACILIFTSIVMSIINLGDIRSFKKIGKQLFSDFSVFLFLGICFTFVCLSPWLKFSFGNGVSASDSFAELIKTVLNMVPLNPISPFIEGNAVQVIVLAIFCGVIFSILGEKVKTVKHFLQEFDTFISCVLEKINLLLPLLIFLVIEDTALGNSLSSFISYKTIVLMWAIAIAVQFVMDLVLVSIFGKMSIASYFKNAGSTLLISLLTGSSVAALPSNMELCKNKFGIDDKLVDLGIPIGQVMFMPGTASVLIANCVGVASVSGMTVSLQWIVTAVIIAFVLSVAAPPIPGAPLAIFSLLFAQMGLSADYLAIVIALGFVTEGIVTSSNLFGLHYVLLKISNKKKDQMTK